MGHWGLFAIWNFPIFYCVCGPSPSSWPKPKFPVESVNIGRIIFFDIFFNSARKVRKNGIGPIKIREKKLLRDFAWTHIILFFFPQMAYKIQCGGDKNASTHFWDWNFFWDILMGPIPFFLTFRAELKKVRIFEIRPKMTDSRGNFKKKKRIMCCCCCAAAVEKKSTFLFLKIS